MNTLIHQHSRLYWILSILIAIGFSSCEKDEAEIGKGAPSITRVRTLSKMEVRNSTTTITTYNSSGVPTTVTQQNSSPQYVPMDSTTTDGKLQNMYAIIGQNLGGVTAVYFNDLSIYFNKSLGSDTTIIVTIPKEAPAGPDQINKLKVETLYGSVEYNFNIILPPPTVIEVSNYNFSAGSQIVFTGIGLASVTSIQLTGTNEMATIVSKSDEELTLTMPASEVNSAKLSLTYPEGVSVTSQEFVNLDKAYKMFTDDYAQDWSGNFWGSGSISGEAFKSGTKSLKLNYGKGNWSANGVANWWPGLTYSPEFKYLSFYVKGGSRDYTFYITGDKKVGGYGNGDTSSPINIPANVWTYFKIPIATVDLWNKGATLNNIGFFIQGPDAQDESIFIDDLIIVK